MPIILHSLFYTLRIVRNKTFALSNFSTTATLARNINFWQRKLRKMERLEEKENERRERRRVKEKEKKPVNAFKKIPKLRGDRRDEEDVRISKTLSWVLRHGAKSEGLPVRQDGYAMVRDLLALPRFRDVNFQTLERIVQHDAKERYHLLFEPNDEEDIAPDDCWWIRANQGHSMKDISLEFSEITDAGQVPMAVHGTNRQSWEKIKEQGLSPMKRTHIHLAQHISHIKGKRATPGLRDDSSILIYINLDKALREGIRFYLSANGVVLTKGDDTGYLRPEYFQRVTDALGTPLPGWSGVRTGQLQRLEGNDASDEQRTRSRSRSRSTEKVTAEVNGPDVDPALHSTTEALSDMSLKEM